MVDLESILDILTKLDVHFNCPSTSPKYIDTVFIAKLGVLELCGWIEHTMDSIVRGAIESKLKLPNYKDMLKSFISDTHGFQYKEHFRPMLIKALGLVNMEKIEDGLDESGQLLTLTKVLENLKEQRNRAAHTFTNVTTTYFAPSTMLGELNKIHPILEVIDDMVTKLSSIKKKKCLTNEKMRCKLFRFNNNRKIVVRRSSVNR